MSINPVSHPQPKPQGGQTSRGSASASTGAGGAPLHRAIPFELRTGWDRFKDGRFVLAKGDGPGIYNRWVAHCGGFRMHCGRIDYAYRPDGTRCA